jgi:hypothetical protein
MDAPTTTTKMKIIRTNARGDITNYANEEPQDSPRDRNPLCTDCKHCGEVISPRQIICDHPAFITNPPDQRREDIDFARACGFFSDK